MAGGAPFCFAEACGMGILSAVLLSMLQDQYRHETSNALRYFARSSWARYRGLENTAAFFEKQAKDEQGHADKVRGWIEDRNMALVPAPYAFDEPSDWTDFDDLFLTGLEIERNTTDKLTKIYQAAFAEGDLLLLAPVMDLLREQIEEESIYQTILDRITARGDDTAAVHDIDVFIGETFNS
jgi:ferritin